MIQLKSPKKNNLKQVMKEEDIPSEDRLDSHISAGPVRH